MSRQVAERFIYILGEQQNGIVVEDEEVMTFTKTSMGQVVTKELELVLANVFARGQYFPGSDGALTAVLHEFVARSERYQQAKANIDQDRCTLIAACKRFDGDVSVKVLAVVSVVPGTLDVNKAETFHALLVASLPDFQNALTEEAYAADSKLIALIKEATLHHIHQNIQ